VKPGQAALIATETPWLGSVPSHWTPMRLRDAVESCLNGVWGDEACGDENDTPIIRVADFDRAGRRTFAHQTVRNVGEDQRKSRELAAGDLLIEKSGGGEQQSVGMVVEYTGPAGAVCSNFVARMRPRAGVHARFMTYLHAHLYSRGVPTLSIKQSTGIQNLDSTAYLGERLHLPPLNEQTAIASYLDAETARIDGLIEEKQRLASFLAELRASIMGEAVQQGLRPDVEVTDSGVPWLGSVPSHWRVVRLKHLLDTLEQGWSPQCDGRQAEEHEWGVLKAGACNGGVFRSEEHKALQAGMVGDPSIEVRAGDVLMSRASGSLDLVGSVAFVREVRPGLMLSDKTFRLRLDESQETSPEWLAMVFNTPSQRRQIASFVGGAEGLARNITSSAIRELWLAVPPPDEQREIVEHVSARLKRVEALSEAVFRETLLLQELHSATITDAVLGRIDVRAHMKN